MRGEGDGASPQPPGETGRSEIGFLSPYPIRSLDLFIYEDRGIRKLYTYIHIDSLIRPSAESPPFETGFVLPSGDYIAVALANCPSPPQIRALQSMDAMENLSVSYASETVAFPFMSGFCQFRAGYDARLHLSSLLCEVKIESVDNLMEGCPLLKNPRVYFRNANASAQVLRQDGFRPTQWMDDPAKMQSPELFIAALPEDIGRYRQEPGLSLHCYPNDSPYDGPGTPRTEIVLEAEKDGETLRFATSLPALMRGRSYSIALSLSEWNLE